MHPYCNTCNTSLLYEVQTASLQQYIVFFLLWSCLIKSTVNAVVKSYRPAGRYDKVSNCQIASLIKVSILKATNRESVRPIVGVHEGSAAIEVEVASSRAANRTTPIVAAGTDTEERTKAAAAVARQRQF